MFVVELRRIEVTMATTDAAPQRVQRMMTQPINIIFRLLQHGTRVQLWLYDQTDLRMEGRIIGLDEYMNLVLDEAEEVNSVKKIKKPLGRILLKGDSISLIQQATAAPE